MLKQAVYVSYHFTSKSHYALRFSENWKYLLQIYSV
jgi:hypothetical protein